jgi:hypothetical protein
MGARVVAGGLKPLSEKVAETLHSPCLPNGWRLTRGGRNRRCNYPRFRTAADGCSRLLDGGPRDYSYSMKLAFELPPAQGEKLRAEAERLGLSAEDLARAAVLDLLATPAADFEAAAARVVSKNQELYRRLA